MTFTISFLNHGLRILKVKQCDENPIKELPKEKQETNKQTKAFSP